MDHGSTLLPSINRLMFMSDLCHEKACICQFDNTDAERPLCECKAQSGGSIVDLSTLCTV